jgi:hypothetical protein
MPGWATTGRLARKLVVHLRTDFLDRDAMAWIAE